jgi:hypothetical protein
VGNFSALETSFPRHCHTIWKEHLSFEVWRGKAASAIFPVKVSVIAFSPFIIPARIEGVTSRLGPLQTYSNWNPELQWNWWRNAFTAYGGHDHRAWHFCTFLLPFFNFPSRPTMMISSPGNSSKRCTSRLSSFVLIIISYPAACSPGTVYTVDPNLLGKKLGKQCNSSSLNHNSKKNS